MKRVLHNLKPYDLEALKYIAYKNVSKDIKTYEDLEQFIITWWCNKYKAPNTDPRLLQKSIEDLIIEYFEDSFRDNPAELKAYEKGYSSAVEAEKMETKKIMGEEYTDEIAYFDTHKKEETSDMLGGNVDIDDVFDIKD